MHSPIPADECWGKLTPRRGEPERWHPLSDHCVDVAACAGRQQPPSLRGVPLFGDPRRLWVNNGPDGPEIRLPLFP